MTGDGVNDAPALKQAEVGIAVSTATAAALAAASLILTTPGLGNIVAAVEAGRRIFQRMLTYTYNKVIKTFRVGFFLSLGLFYSAKPDRWHLRPLVVSALEIAAGLLVALAVGSLLYGFVLDFLKVHVFRRQGVLAV
jgi:magnesium-transporting ATPase (P-type)